jgi:hypothetical protein
MLLDVVKTLLDVENKCLLEPPGGRLVDPGGPGHLAVVNDQQGPVLEEGQVQLL